MNNVQVFFIVGLNMFTKLQKLRWLCLMMVSSLGQSKNINMLLIGDTGVGKSTFYHALDVLHLSGSSDEEKRQIILAGEIQTEDSMIRSQTRTVQSKKIELDNDMTLTVYDIPGFGDSESDLENSNKLALEAILQTLLTVDGGIHVIAQVMRLEEGGLRDKNRVIETRKRVESVFNFFIDNDTLNERLIVIGTGYDIATKNCHITVNQREREARAHMASISQILKNNYGNSEYYKKSIFPFGFKWTLQNHTFNIDDLDFFAGDSWNPNATIFEKFKVHLKEIKDISPIDNQKIGDLRNSKVLIDSVFLNTRKIVLNKTWISQFERTYKKYTKSQKEQKAVAAPFVGSNKCNNEKDFCLKKSAWDEKTDNIIDLDFLEKKGQEKFEEKIKHAQRDKDTIGYIDSLIKEFMKKIDHMREIDSFYKRYVNAKNNFFSVQDEITQMSEERVSQLKSELRILERSALDLKARMDVEDARFDAECRRKACLKVHGDENYDIFRANHDPFHFAEVEFDIRSSTSYQRNDQWSYNYYDCKREIDSIKSKIKRHYDLKEDLPRLESQYQSALHDIESRSINLQVVKDHAKECLKVKEALEKAYPSHFEGYFKGKDLWFFQKWFSWSRDDVNNYCYNNDLQKRFDDRKICSCGQPFERHHIKVKSDNLQKKIDDRRVTFFNKILPELAEGLQDSLNGLWLSLPAGSYDQISAKKLWKDKVFNDDEISLLESTCPMGDKLGVLLRNLIESLDVQSFEDARS